jgi:hypothetical protein
MRGVSKASTSFLKKRSKKLLFPRGFHGAGQGLDRAAGPRSKGLLVLFFRKEHSCLTKKADISV